MTEPVIVTAFWDVGRGSNCAIPRSNDRYYTEFNEWARIKNKLIVYTDPKSAAIISKIREQYNLLDKTKIIITDNIFEVEPDIYKRLIEIEKKGDFGYKLYPSAMSNRANFNYAWFMIYWCIADAKKYVSEDTLLAWFDFGFNHIDSCFSKMEEFDFLWTCNINMKKVHLFSLVPIENLSVIDIFQFQQDVMMGVFHLIPANKAEDLWKLVRMAMVSLLMLQCMDDDQMLLLMAVKYKPELFEIHVSDWYRSLKECGATHLTEKEKKPMTLLQYLKIPFIGIRGDFMFASRLKKRLKKTRKQLMFSQTRK